MLRLRARVQDHLLVFMFSELFLNFQFDFLEKLIMIILTNNSTLHSNARGMTKHPMHVGIVIRKEFTIGHVHVRMRGHLIDLLLNHL